MAEITTFDAFVKRVLEIVFWLLIILPLAALPIFYLFYVLPSEISCGFSELGCASTINWAAALYMFDPTKLSPFVSNGLPAMLLGYQNVLLLFRMSTFPGLTFAALFATLVILYERKLLAKMQYRVGPLYAGKFEGILQPIADLFKLLFKEIVIPEKADKLFFIAPPFAMMALAGALVAIIPIGTHSPIATSQFSLLIVIALLGFFPIIALMAGWASNNKFSFIGALRALYQMISYEIPLIISVLGVVILAGTLDLTGIVAAQGTIWYILPMAIGALVFYIAAMAEVERIPFDLPEADSEIVAGWVTEYTSMIFGTIQLATYIKLYALSALFTILFLGGWAGPAPVPGFVWFIIKTFVVVTVFLIPRGASPRVRIDQLINFGWVWLVGLAFLNVFIAVLLKATGIL